MQIHIHESTGELGQAAATRAAQLIRSAIQLRGEANIILATGASQFQVLSSLVAATQIDWSRVRMFHLDEYIGLDENHPASFRKYLRERFAMQVPQLTAAHFIRGDVEDPEEECDRVGDLIEAHPIDVALIGIGENGHLAFNDPPADFESEFPYIVVELDEACRRQQLGEGWFPNLEAVPETAISMSIPQIMKSQHLIVSVPDERKSRAVRQAIKGPLTPDCPASILREHPSCHIYLDEASSSRL